MPPRTVRPPVPLQASPPGKSIAAHLIDSIEEANDAFDLAGQQHINNNPGLTGVSRLRWLDNNYTLITRSAIEFRDGANVDIGEELTMIEEGDTTLSHAQNITDSLVGLVGNPETDDGQRLQQLVVQLMGEVPNAETEWLKRKYPGHDEQSLIEAIARKCDKAYEATQQNANEIKQLNDRNKNLREQNDQVKQMQEETDIKYREIVRNMQAKCDELSKSSKGKDDTIDCWMEVIFTFILRHSKNHWAFILAETNPLDEVFTKLHELRFLTTIRPEKIAVWSNVIVQYFEPSHDDAILSALQIWFWLIDPNRLPDLPDVLNLIDRMQEATQGLSQDDLCFIAACIEHGVISQARMALQTPSQWTENQYMAWLRLVDMLATFYDHYVTRLNIDMSIDMTTGCKGVLVNAFRRYVADKLSSSGPPTPLGQVIAIDARKDNTGIRRGQYDLIPDGSNLIITTMASDAEHAVHVFPRDQFMLEGSVEGWILTVNHFPVPGKASKFRLDRFNFRETSVVNLMTDALIRDFGGNKRFLRLPVNDDHEGRVSE